MSLEYLNTAFNVDLKGAKKSVLIALADRANNAGYCYPSINDTAFRSGLSESTVKRAVFELEKQGFLTIIRETGKVNKYILLISDLSTTEGTETPLLVIHSQVRVTPTEVIAVKNQCHSELLTINKPSLTIKERNFFKAKNQNTNNQTNAQSYKIFNKQQSERTKNGGAKSELKNIKSLLSGGYNHE